MLVPLAFAFSAVLSQQAATQTPTPDRSGEKELRRVLKAAGEMRNVFALIVKSERNRSQDVLEPDKTISLWYGGPKRFRIVMTGMWGDGTLYVSDGTGVLVDPLTDGVPATISDPAADLPAAHEDLRFGGASWSFLFYILGGEVMFDRLVKPDGTIKVTDDEGINRAITFTSKDVGTVNLYYHEGGEITRIEYDNMPNRMARYNQFPMWYDRPETPLEREEIRIDKSGFGKDLFALKPTSGAAVNDRRKKG